MCVTESNKESEVIRLTMYSRLVAKEGFDRVCYVLKLSAYELNVLLVWERSKIDAINLTSNEYACCTYAESVKEEMLCRMAVIEDIMSVGYMWIGQVQDALEGVDESMRDMSTYSPDGSAVSLMWLDEMVCRMAVGSNM